MENKATAELIGTRLVVWNPRDGTELYRSGFYGKPVGIPKPKPEQDFTVPLMLDIMEGLYLYEKKKINIADPRTKKMLNKKYFLIWLIRPTKGSSLPTLSTRICETRGT